VPIAVVRNDVSIHEFDLSKELGFKIDNELYVDYVEPPGGQAAKSGVNVGDLVTVVGNRSVGKGKTHAGLSAMIEGRVLSTQLRERGVPDVCARSIMQLHL
jgi:hypothetical protein